MNIYIHAHTHTYIHLSHLLMEILLFLIIFNLVSSFYTGSHLGHSLFLTLFTVCVRPPRVVISLRSQGAEWLNAVFRREMGWRWIHPHGMDPISFT